MKRKNLLGKILFGLALLVFILTASGPVAQAQNPDLKYKVYAPLVGGPVSAPSWFGPSGGSVLSLAADPQNLDIVYAGTNGAGVFKSVNGGATWARANAGLSNLWILSLAVDPQRSSIVYAGTQDYGVYKSSDGGTTWNPINTGIYANSVVYALAVNPGNTDLVYAGTRIENTQYGALYKSSNTGSNWTPVFSQATDWVYSLAVSPMHPNIILAATHLNGAYVAKSYGNSGDWGQTASTSGEWYSGRAVAFDRRSNTDLAYYATLNSDFYRSTNNGSNWSLYDNGLANTHTYPNGISIKPGSPNTIYLASHDNGHSSDGGVYKSTDSGQNWAQTGLRNKTVYTVAVSSGDIVLAGTYLEGLYRSTDGGVTWTQSNSGLFNAQVTGVVFTGGSTLYASTEGGGVSKSTDGGKTWIDFNTNLTDRFVHGLVKSPTNSNLIYALVSNGLFQNDTSTSFGWMTVGGLPASQDAGIDPTSREANPQVRREALDDYLQLEGLPEWKLPQPQAENGAASASAAGVNAMAFAPSDPNIVYLATNAGLYMSTTSIVSFKPTGLAGVVKSVAVNATNPSIVYASTGTAGQIKRSIDSGATWTTLALPDTSLTINSLAMWLVEPDSVCAGTSNGVWKYNGTTWAKIGLSGYTVTTLVNSPFHPDLIAGTTWGAFYAPDHTLWIPVAPEIGIVNIQSINFNLADTTHVYFGTIDRGTVKVMLLH